MKILYVTDVEGNWDYFLRFVHTVDTSPHSAGALTFADDTHTRLVLQPGYIFVFGGDVGDKGNGTLRLIHLLVDAKLRYPDRVVLIAGNRDANKMRWTSEFTPAEMHLSTMDPGIKDGPHWTPERQRKALGIVPYLTKQLRATSTADATAPIDDLTDLSAVNTPVNRMKWILACTMGSDGDFERRRTELALYRHTPAPNADSAASPVTDQDVLDSFLSSVDTGGIMRQYLELCVLGAVFGSTIILHGGIIAGRDERLRCCLGRVPPADSHSSYAEWVAAVDRAVDEAGTEVDPNVDVARWIDDLNAWYRTQIDEWVRFPTWNADHTFRGGENLQHYVNTGAAYSVIGGRHLERSGMPKPMPQPMTDLLVAQGYRRMLVGHTPHGNAPTIVKHTSNAAGEFQVIMCDTSYSDMSAHDMRGQCTSIVVVDHPKACGDGGGAWPRGDDDATVWVQGHMDHKPSSVKESFGFTADDDPFVGRLLESTGEWVKTVLEHDRYLVCTVTNAHTYTYAVKTKADVAEAAAATNKVQ